MTTAQILPYPARHGGVLHDRITDLRRERDELVQANEYQALQIERLIADLDAERAHRPKPRAPWGPVILAAIVGACVVIGLHWRFG